MYLDSLIKKLEEADQSAVLKLGFYGPHSYRGNYYDLAFEPGANIRVSDMLKDAKWALGQTFEGWKGGEFTMQEWANCYLAHEGEIGEEIGPRLLDYMLADVVASKPIILDVVKGPSCTEQMLADPEGYWQRTLDEIDRITRGEK